MQLPSASQLFPLLLLALHVAAVPMADALPGPDPEALAGPQPLPVPDPYAEAVPEPYAPPEMLDEFSSGLVVRAPKSNCSNQQVNQCSTGVPYCCSTGGNGHSCNKATVDCKQTVICCNNNFGFQICLGAIDFNIPITINVNV